MSGAASNIVAMLKSKIKETADELEKYEGVCEETRVRWRHTALLTLVTVLSCDVHFNIHHSTIHNIDFSCCVLSSK